MILDRQTQIHIALCLYIYNEWYLNVSRNSEVILSNNWKIGMIRTKKNVLNCPFSKLAVCVLVEWWRRHIWTLLLFAWTKRLWVRATERLMRYLFYLSSAFVHILWKPHEIRVANYSTKSFYIVVIRLFDWIFETFFLVQTEYHPLSK